MWKYDSWHIQIIWKLQTVIYTVGHKQMCQLTSVKIFAKYWPILKQIV